MGCDIHIYVERKVDGKWYNCDYFIQSTNKRLYSNPPGMTRVETMGNRNYALFATLANVRNYGGTEFISEPKGIPEDVSDYVREEYEDDFDIHSYSYLTLQELIDFHNAGHPLKRRGMLSPEQQKALDEGILPTSWCQGTNQPGWEFREWEEENNVLVPLIEDLKRRADEMHMIYDFSWDGNEQARRKAYEKSADIRIVFWFDN